MSYKISFYGDRQSETIPDERGKLLYDDYQTGEMPPRVEIRAGLTIESKSIRSIEWVVDGQPTAYQMSHAELRQFEESKLRTYLDEHGELKPIKELQFLVAEGLIDLVMHKETYQSASDATIYIKSHLVGAYTKMMDKLEQYKEYAGRRSYARRKEAEDLEKLGS